MKNRNAFHAPLHPFDTEKQTHGCRHTDPFICSRHNLPKICAFVQNNNICLEPPLSWPRQYKKLKDERDRSSLEHKSVSHNWDK